MVIGFEIFLFGGVQRGTGDFLYLKPQQIELLRVGGLIDHEIGLGLLNLSAALEQGGEGGARLLQSAKGIENGKLSRGMQQRLMIVRSVHVDQPFANPLEHSQSGGATIDELAIAAGGRERAFEEQLVFLAGFQTVLFQKPGQWRIELGYIEVGLDGALISLGADERTIGAFAQHKIESTDEDRLARARLATDGIVAGPELQCEIGDQGKVAYA